LCPFQNEKQVDKSFNLWHVAGIDITEYSKYLRSLFMADYFFKVVIEPQSEGGFTLNTLKSNGMSSKGDGNNENLS
jgi:hypothetical protein